MVPFEQPWQIAQRVESDALIERLAKWVLCVCTAFSVHHWFQYLLWLRARTRVATYVATDVYFLGWAALSLALWYYGDVGPPWPSWLAWLAAYRVVEALTRELWVI